MKKLIVVLLLLVSPFSSFSRGIKFFEGTFEQAKEKAKKENKLIFVDFYAVWCGPCKYMSSNVFTDSLIGTYFNKYFVPVKIDAEKHEQELVKRTEIQAYPTLAFYKNDGSLFYKVKGGMDVENFMKLGKQIAEFDKNRIAWEKNKDVNALASYLLVLKQSDEEKANKMATDYLKSVPVEKASEPENWSLIMTFEKDYNSKFFLYSMDHFKYFLDSVPGYQAYFTSVTADLIAKSIETKDTSLLSTYKKYAKTAMEAMGQDFPTAFNYEVDIYFFAQTGQQEKHIMAMDKYLMYYTSETQKVVGNSYDMLERYGIEVMKPYVEKWAKKAMTLEKTSYTWMLYAHIQRESGDKNEALKYAKEALSIATAEDDTQYIRDFISELED